MRVSLRLTLGFSIILAIAVLVGIIGITGMHGLRESGVYMYENRMRSLGYVNEAMNNFNDMKLDNYRVIISANYDDHKGALDSSQHFEEHAENFMLWMGRSREIAQANRIDELLEFHDIIIDLFENDYLPNTRSINAMSINDIPDHHNRLYINVQNAAVSNTTLQIQQFLTGMIDLNAALANQANIDNARLTRRYMFLQIMLLITAAVFGAAVAFFIIKSIAVPINESEAVLKEIAQGKFEARIKGDYKGNFKTIKDSVNNTAQQLSIFLDEKLNAERAAHEADIEKARIEAAADAVMSGIKYASRIQHNILPQESEFKEFFRDYSITWKPRDIVGGDIYWMKRFKKGAVLCLCDCTGHGTSGALLTMLVTSAFEDTVNEKNCNDTAEIIFSLEQRLVSVFGVFDENGKDAVIQDGCDLAVVFINKNGSVTFSSGHIHLFVCDGKEVRQIKGQKIFIGEGRLSGKNDIKTVNIPKNTDNKFYIASDGLFEQVGGKNNEPYGYNEFKKVILENHNEKQSVISEKIWQTFETYRAGEPQVDDFQLITFKP